MVLRSRMTGRWAVIMSKDDYRERAAECFRLANESSNPGHCASLRDMALAWLLLYDQAEKNSQADIVYEPPPLHSAELDDGQTP